MHGRLHTKLYDKRDEFNFPIINIPFFSSKTLFALSYGDYIYKSNVMLVHVHTIWTSNTVCSLNTLKLLQQSYEEKGFKMTLRNFDGHHDELIGLNGGSLSN